jgi:hypothetical protein
MRGLVKHDAKLRHVVDGAYPMAHMVRSFSEPWSQRVYPN